MRGIYRDFLLGVLFLLVLAQPVHFVQPAPSQWQNGRPEITFLLPLPESYVWGDALFLHWDFANNSEISTDLPFSGYIKNLSLIAPVEGVSVVEMGLNFSNYHREYVYNFTKNHFTSANIFQNVNFTFILYYLAAADERGPAYVRYEKSYGYTWMGYGLGNFCLPPLPFLIVSIVGLVSLTVFLVYRNRRQKKQGLLQLQ